jgi:hypothetical protein
LPRGKDGYEEVVAAARYVRPPRRPDVVHGEFEPVGLEQVERHVSHQGELACFGSRPS